MEMVILIEPHAFEKRWSKSLYNKD